MKNKTPRYRHVRFYTLKIGEMFFLGVCAFWKVDYFRGRSLLGAPAIVMPWTRVRSARPFGKVPTVISPGENNAALGYKASVNNVAPGYKVYGISDRAPVEVTPGGDRTSETLGGNEKCPSS